MKTAESFQLRLQTLILIVLIPLLLFVIAGYGWSNYSAIYSTILTGFDRKLEAISTTSAAFIDGAEHQRLIAPREVQAAVYDPVSKRIIGFDRGNGLIVSLDAQTGSADELVALKQEAGRAPLRSVTFDETKKQFFGLLDDGRSVVRVSIEDGAVQPIFMTETAAGAIAFDRSSGTLLLAGEYLERAFNNGRMETIAKLGLPGIRGFVQSEDERYFYAADSSSGYLFKIAASTGAITLIGPIIQNGNDKVPPSEASTAEGEEAEQWVEPQIVKLPVHSLVFNSETSQLYAITDRVIRVASDTGAGDPAGFRAWFRSDTSALYNKFAAPMQRIMAELGLTYHYSLILPSEGQQIYVLDATQGENHSPAGTEEEVDAEEWSRLSEVFRTGEPSQSDVKQFDIWGILKVGTAPIFNAQGEVVALAGADVDISVIHAKTRVALLQLLAVGAISLILAALVSFYIAKRLIDPVNRLKEGALQIAAGHFARAVVVRRPRELSKLAAAFDEVRTTLRDRIATLKEENDRFEAYRRRQSLMKIFAREGGRDAPALSVTFEKTITAHLIGENTRRRESSGWVERADLVLVWLADSPPDALRAVKLRADIRLICGRLLERYGRDWELLSSELESLFLNEVYLFVLLDASTGSVRSIARREAAATLVSAQKACSSFLLLEHPTMQLEPGQSFILSSRQNGSSRSEDGIHAVLTGELEAQAAEHPELCAVMRSQ